MIEIAVPGSKSITNRVLALAAFQNRKLTIKNAATCTDAEYMIKGLNDLAITAHQNEDIIIVEGNGGNFAKQKDTIRLYTHNAGTTTRFLTAISTLTGNEITLDGDERIRERPIKPLTDALNQLGVQIETSNDCVPLQISRKRPIGGKILLPGNISSQYLTALLLIAPFLEKNTEIEILDDLCSKPYIEITLKVLEKFGLNIKNHNFEKFTISGRQKPKEISEFIVESDASSASYIGGYAALNPTKNILLKNIFADSIQGDIKFLEYLEKMGCQIINHSTGTQIKGPETLQSLGKINMNSTPDLVMTFSVLSIFTPGTTRITDIENLRIKETDRISALEKELRKLGISVNAGQDFIEITGDPKIKEKLKNITTEIHTYNDHRMAMCFGMIQEFSPEMKIQNPQCVEKSYISFWQDLRKLKNPVA